jgi:hypothetical protein
MPLTHRPHATQTTCDVNCGSPGYRWRSSAISPAPGVQARMQWAMARRQKRTACSDPYPSLYNAIMDHAAQEDARLELQLGHPPRSVSSALPLPPPPAPQSPAPTSSLPCSPEHTATRHRHCRRYDRHKNWNSGDPLAKRHSWVTERGADSGSSPTGSH